MKAHYGRRFLHCTCYCELYNLAMIRTNLVKAMMLNQERSRKSTEKTYPCKFCDKIFHSPQALGGHQNLHRMQRTNSKKLQRSEQNGNANSSHSGSSMENSHKNLDRPSQWCRSGYGNRYHPYSSSPKSDRSFKALTHDSSADNSFLELGYPGISSTAIFGSNTSFSDKETKLDKMEKTGIHDILNSCNSSAENRADLCINGSQKLFFNFFEHSGDYNKSASGINSQCSKSIHDGVSSTNENQSGVDDPKVEDELDLTLHL